MRWRLVIPLLGMVLVPSVGVAEPAAPPDRVYFDALRTDEAGRVHLYVRAETERGRTAELTGRPPLGFAVRQDGRPIDADALEVLRFEQTDEGMACVVVLDVSPSMSAVFDRVRSSVLGFLDRLGPADRAAVVVASGDPRVHAGFSASLEEARARVEGLEAERDPLPTRLLDAIELAFRRLRSDARLPARRFVLVVSDGSDGGSARTLEEVIESASPADAARIPVFSVLLRDPAFGRPRAELLDALAARTGGTVLREASLASTFYDELWQRLRQSYIVRYAGPRDGGLHTVELIMDGLVAPGARAALFPRRVPLARWSVGFGLALGLAGVVAWLRRRRRVGCLVGVGMGAEGLRFPLRRGLNAIGSIEDNDVVVASPAISRYHAVFYVGRGRAEIEDRQSTNGTFVNDKPITVSHVTPGDRIRVGDVELLYLR